MTDISAAFKLVISFIPAPAQKLFENGDDGFVPIGLKQTVVGFDYSMRIECVQPDYRFSVILSDGQAHFIAVTQSFIAFRGGRHDDRHSRFFECRLHVLSFQRKLIFVGYVLQGATSALSECRTGGRSPDGRRLTCYFGCDSVAELLFDAQNFGKASFAGQSVFDENHFAVKPCHALAVHSHVFDIKFYGLIFFHGFLPEKSASAFLYAPTPSFPKRVSVYDKFFKIVE